MVAYTSATQEGHLLKALLRRATRPEERPGSWCSHVIPKHFSKVSNSILTSVDVHPHAQQYKDSADHIHKTRNARAQSLAQTVTHNIEGYGAQSHELQILLLWSLLRLSAAPFACPFSGLRWDGGVVSSHWGVRLYSPVACVCIMLRLHSYTP